MEASRSDDDLRAQALKRLQHKRAFRMQVFWYVAVNALLVIIWAVTDSGFFWPIFPIAGWGIGIVSQAYGIYGQKPIGEDEINREVEKLR